MKPHVEKHLKQNLRIQANRRYAAKMAERQSEEDDYWDSDDGEDDDEDRPRNNMSRHQVTRAIHELFDRDQTLVKHIDRVERRVGRNQFALMLISGLVIGMFTACVQYAYFTH